MSFNLNPTILESMINLPLHIEEAATEAAVRAYRTGRPGHKNPRGSLAAAAIIAKGLGLDLNDEQVKAHVAVVMQQVRFEEALRDELLATFSADTLAALSL